MAPYDLDALGWLLFEHVATLAVERELGLDATAWQGSSDQRRDAWSDAPLDGVPSPPPVALRMVWERREHGPGARLARLLERSDRPVDVLVTNADEETVADGLAGLVLGARWLSGVLEQQGSLRLQCPAALGVRDGGPGVATRTASFDADGAAALARVFVPVRAYARTVAVLDRHRFAVLTGPPEMGKTAIARMIALALATDGWEAHECLAPDELWTAWRAERAQLFVADDAFGSTEYRPETAEAWAREMERVLRSLDDRHRLIWTSRPTPLHRGLARIHRERGAERFPQPGAVLVEAAALDRAEKALILFRHAVAAARFSTAAPRIVRAHGAQIVDDPHFTPERIRRFATGAVRRLPASAADHDQVSTLLRRELREPTQAMAASLHALRAEERAVLVALVDCPPGPVAERDLAAAARRHAGGGLPRSPAELTDRLADHFLHVSEQRVAWVHPSWRDLVIEEIAADDAARAAFLAHAGLEGLLLALSVGGGREGERAFPLLRTDADWDVLGDRMRVELREVDDHDALRLLLGVSAALDARREPAPQAELEDLAATALSATCGRFLRSATPTPVSLLAAWLEVAARTDYAGAEPPLERTWFALLPPAEAAAGPEELELVDDWLWLAQALAQHDPDLLLRLGFPAAYDDRIAAVIGSVDQPVAAGDQARAMQAAVRRRLERLGLLAARAAAVDEATAVPSIAVGHEPILPPVTTVERILRDL